MIGLLAIAFAAMQFTDEVRWQLPDFVLPFLGAAVLFRIADGNRRTGGE